jgi:hypothetical protein
MYTLSDFKQIYNKIKEKQPDIQYDIFSEFMISKFSETAGIFKKFDVPAIVEFVNKTRYGIHEDEQTVFEKGSECSYYIFILNGK